MQTIPLLKLDWCSYKAAKFACVNWHYSKRMPDPKCVKIGVWEDDKFKGAVIFSRGISGSNIAKSLSIEPTEIAELSRVALKDCINTTSKIVSIAIILLKKKACSLKLLVSYADFNVGHMGIIYQAGNWLYMGKSAKVPIFQDKNGNLIHDRSCSSTGYKKQFGSIKKVPNRNNLIRINQVEKWKYFMPLTKEMRKQILPLSKPYPKREPISTDSTFPVEKGGANPTLTLQKSL